MVSSKVVECETIERWSAMRKKKSANSKKKTKKLVLVGLINFVVIFVIVLAVLMVIRNNNGNIDNTDDVAGTQEETPVEEIEIVEPVKIEGMDFQPLIDDWADSTSGRKGIIIYDLAAEKISGEYNADTKFATASLYKLFVVYEGYKKLQSGEWLGDDVAGWTGHSIMECLDLAIRESNSECAETLWSMIGRDELNNVVQNEFGLSDIEVGTFMATPREIMKMMTLFYKHVDIVDDGLVGVMKDSFLNQPVTIYDWRQGLPSGFSENVAVYNKVGWNYNGEYWDIYNDAAIVDFVQDGRAFVVVVMTSGMSFKNIVRFGERLEEEFRLLLHNTAQKAEL